MCIGKKTQSSLSYRVFEFLKHLFLVTQGQELMILALWKCVWFLL